MLCEYTLLSGGEDIYSIEISKYKFIDDGVLLINFGEGETTFIPYKNLAILRFITKEKNNGDKNEMQLQA